MMVIEPAATGGPAMNRVDAVVVVAALAEVSVCAPMDT